MVEALLALPGVPQQIDGKRERALQVARRRLARHGDGNEALSVVVALLQAADDKAVSPYPKGASATVLAGCAMQP